MSQDYHTPIAAGSAVTSDSVNDPMGQLDEELTKRSKLENPRGNLVLVGTFEAPLIMNEGRLWVFERHLWFLWGRDPASGNDGTNLSER